MLRIIFKNLKKSEIATDAVQKRFDSLLERFPELKDHRLSATLSMENSPKQPGADVFTVKFHIQGNKYRLITLEKSASNLYAALADVADHSLERLNRFGDRTRTKRLRQERRLLSFSEQEEVHE